ncbi:MAG: NmrA family NAD(P)-binding protein [Polyangiales bacterium]
MYVVTGATGNTGKIVAERLLEAGKRVRAIVRSREKAAALAERGAEIVVADLHDERLMADAVSGAQGVYLLSPPDQRAADFIADRKRLSETLARVLERASVPHVVLLSSIAAQHAQGTGPIITAYNAEQALKSAGVTSTFLRAGYFIENWASVLPVAKQDGVLPAFFPLDKQVWMIDTRDIGEVAAKVLLAGPPKQRTHTIELSGPVPVSPSDVAATLSRVLGRVVHPVHVPLEQVVPQLTSVGISPQFAALMHALNDAITHGDRITWEGQGERVLAKTTLEDSLRALVG